MASETEIANLALFHLGISKEIANIDTENSKEARACRKFYGLARDATLRGFMWPFSTRTATLGLVEEDPTTEWAYSYRYPSDCLFLRKILSGTRLDTNNSRVPYLIVGDSTARLIYTDEDSAVAEYTKKFEDAGQFTEDFVLALSFRLASYIAPMVTNGDRFKLGEKAFFRYSQELATSQASAIHEEQEEKEVESEFIRGRE